MTEEKKVTITFAGAIASGKSVFLKIAADAFEDAGHAVTKYDQRSHIMEVVMNKEALPFETPPEPPVLQALESRFPWH